jgi:hypothetical protein
MRPELWKIYDKKGSNLNLFNDAYLNMIFSTDVGKDAAGYAITDPSENIVSTFITNGGFGYDTNTAIYLDYTFDNVGPFQVDASVFYKDVSVFNPEPSNSSSIYAVTIDDSTNYIYPSVTYAGAIFLEPVSVGLIETEHLTILQESSAGFVTPYDASNSTLIFRMIGDENQIQFFVLDEHMQEITWTDELVYDVSTYQVNQGIQINVGFHSDEEGVYERRMVVYHSIGGNEYPLMEIVVNAQSIGQDERYDTMLENFGLYKPKSIPQLFKEADINEALPDWELLNYKSKHMILEHNQIMPFIGTYKGLINAIKWLGYEDIQVKEWFKDVKENKKISLYVPYDADGRKKTIKYFSPEERRNLKKLNQLSLVYCITRETGEFDEWGNPITENCYEYNLNEILVKLFALKNWLERNIIGVNARIYDLTGEGVYFERFENYIYGTQNEGTVAIYVESLTPIELTPDSELVTGDASIVLSLKEFDQITIGDFPNNKIIDFARYGWDPSNGFFSPEEYYTQGYADPSAVFIGSPFSSPFIDLYDLQWKLLVEKEFGVATIDFVTNPLFVYENEIRFYNIFDASSFFLDISANVDVTIETGYLRDPSIDVWLDSIAYSIYKEIDPSGNNTGKWVFESSMGVKQYTWGEFSLQTSTTPQLMYAVDANYMVPLLSIVGYKWTDASGNSNDLDKLYFLDILDGIIAMDSSTVAVNGDWINIENFINFNYDTSLAEQKITLNVTYTSPRMPLFNYDPSDASTLYYNPDASIVLIDDNSTYQMNVHHAGLYDVEVYGFNGQNNLFFNFDRDGYRVWQKYPTINSYIDTSCAGNVIFSCTSTYLTQDDVSLLIGENLHPIFDRVVPLQGLTLEYDINDNPYLNVPSITFFQDLPENNSLSRYYNLTERVTDIAGLNIQVDKDFQWFNAGDTVKVVKFDKGKYSFLEEASSMIVTAADPNYTLDAAPVDFVIDPSYQWYLLNDTQRAISNPVNDLDNKTFKCDISTGDSSESFRINQLVAIIIYDLSTGYSWGSSFRVIDASTTDSSTGVCHTFKGNIPDFILADPGQYVLSAKHAFSTYVDLQIDVDHAVEVNNNFHVYLNDPYFHQYYLDSTFVFVSILFDQEKVLLQWYDPSDNLINGAFYPFDHSIELDASTLVIFKSEYDVSNYMLNQKNIWQITNHDTMDILLRVHNFVVPYNFDEVGTYDVQVESYDSYGNLKKQVFEGLISII